jgi:hypothetical protein
MATHAHPCGILVTVYPGNSHFRHINPKEVLINQTLQDCLPTTIPLESAWQPCFKGIRHHSLMPMAVFVSAGVGPGMVLPFLRVVSGAVSPLYGLSGQSYCIN